MRAARAARLSFRIYPIRSLFSDVLVSFAVVAALIPYSSKCIRRRHTNSNAVCFLAFFVSFSTPRRDVFQRKGQKLGSGKISGILKARLHRRFLSRQLDAIFVALKLQQVSNTFETPAISRRQIALKIALGLHVRF